jgi:hypothetical protein
MGKDRFGLFMADANKEEVTKYYPDDHHAVK